MRDDLSFKKRGWLALYTSVFPMEISSVPNEATLLVSKVPTPVNITVRPWPAYILERWLESLERSCPRDEVSESLG